jgi:hypothetical protein
MHMSNPDPVRINHELPGETWGAFCADVLAAYVATLPPGAKRPLTIAALVPLALCALAVYLGLSSRVLPDRWRMALARACPPGRRPAKAQTDLLDFLTLPTDPTPGAFVSFSRLRSDEPRIECDGYALNIGHVLTEEDVARVAFAAGWGVLPESRGLVQGVRLLPPSLVVPWCAANPVRRGTASVETDDHAEAIAHYHDGLAWILRGAKDVRGYRDPRSIAADFLGINEEDFADHNLDPLTPVDPPGVFVSLVRLKSGTVSIELEGRTLSLHGCRAIPSAASRAASEGWSVKPVRQDNQPGLLFALAERLTDEPEEIDDVPVCGIDCAKDHSMPERNEIILDPPTNPATPSALQIAEVTQQIADIAEHALSAHIGEPDRPDARDVVRDLGYDPDAFASIRWREDGSGLVLVPNSTARDITFTVEPAPEVVSFREKSNVTMTRDDKAEARANGKAKAPVVKSSKKKSKPSGAESKIRKGKDRAAK